MVSILGYIEREGNSMVRVKEEIWGLGNIWITLLIPPDRQLPPLSFLPPLPGNGCWYLLSNFKARKHLCLQAPTNHVAFTHLTSATPLLYLCLYPLLGQFSPSSSQLMSY